MSAYTTRAASRDRALQEMRSRCALIAHRQPTDEERAQLLAVAFHGEGFELGDVGERVEDMLTLDQMLVDAIAHSASADADEYALRLGREFVRLARAQAAPLLMLAYHDARDDYRDSLRNVCPVPAWPSIYPVDALP